MEEKKLVVCRKHWISFLLPGAYAVLSIFNLRALIAMIRNGDKVALLMLIAAALAVLHIVIWRDMDYIELTATRLLVHHGFSDSIPRAQIRGIKLSYSLLGIFLGYATITVMCWGEGEKNKEIKLKRLTKGEKLARALDDKLIQRE